MSLLFVGIEYQTCGSTCTTPEYTDDTTITSTVHLLPSYWVIMGWMSQDCLLSEVINAWTLTERPHHPQCNTDCSNAEGAHALKYWYEWPSSHDPLEIFLLVVVVFVVVVADDVVVVILMLILFLLLQLILISPSSVGSVGLKTKRSGARFPLLVMCRSVRQTSHLSTLFLRAPSTLQNGVIEVRG